MTSSFPEILSNRNGITKQLAALIGSISSKHAQKKTNHKVQNTTSLKQGKHIIACEKLLKTKDCFGKTDAENRETTSQSKKMRNLLHYIYVQQYLPVHNARKFSAVFGTKSEKSCGDQTKKAINITQFKGDM